MSNDLISRQDVIDAIRFGITYANAINTLTGEKTAMFEEANEALEEAVTRVLELPIYSAKEDIAESYEWCMGCKEYDNEKHCCHRYTNFIRYSLQENIDSVLEDIKAELEKREDIPYDVEMYDYIQGLEYAISVIEKHISGKESE